MSVRRGKADIIIPLAITHVSLQRDEHDAGAAEDGALSRARSPPVARRH
jgi:hypothetical protein